jgi:DNA-binding transcriptional MerR regulator
MSQGCSNGGGGVMRGKDDYRSTIREYFDSIGAGDEHSSPKMTIGEVSSVTELTPRAIRFYEAQGFVSPHRSGRFRLFSLKDVAALKLVRTLREVGSGLDDIAGLFVLVDGQQSTNGVESIVCEFLERQQLELGEEMDLLKQKLASCDILLEVTLTEGM